MQLAPVSSPAISAGHTQWSPSWNIQWCLTCSGCTCCMPPALITSHTLLTSMIPTSLTLRARVCGCIHALAHRLVLCTSGYDTLASLTVASRVRWQCEAQSTLQESPHMPRMPRCPHTSLILQLQLPLHQPHLVSIMYDLPGMTCLLQASSHVRLVQSERWHS